MTTERREEQSEVLNPNVAYVRPVAPTTGGPARSTTAQQTETYTSDPYAGRRDGTLRIQRGIYLLFGILEGLLAIRFALRLLGAGQNAGFSQFIYSITSPFLAPFEGLFGTARFEGSVFEWNVLAAILVYALIAWVLVKVVGLAMGETRRGVRTTSSQIETDMK